MYVVYLEIKLRLGPSLKKYIYCNLLLVKCYDNKKVKSPFNWAFDSAWGGNKQQQKKNSNINSYKFRDQNFVQKIWAAKNEQGKLKDKF